MGSSFRSQISPINHEQLRWVPRSDDQNGGGNQGGSLVMSVFGEDVLFNSLAITDTVAHMSQTPGVTNPNPEGTPYDQVYAVQKTAVLESTLNQSVSVQPMWSRDRVNWYAFGTATAVNAYSGSGVAQTAVIALSTPSLYLPYVGLQATCATAPTSGTLSGWLERLG